MLEARGGDLGGADCVARERTTTSFYIAHCEGARYEIRTTKPMDRVAACFMKNLNRYYNRIPDSRFDGLSVGGL